MRRAPEALPSMVCASCGTPNPEPARYCMRCGAPQPVMTLPPPVPAAPAVGFARLIPMQNPQALIAYYCAVFSLIPCVGVPLALAALVLGILGGARLSEHPEAGGRFHAGVGIVVGLLVLVGHAVGAVYLLRT